MNKIYKVVWNTVRNCYVVGSELISSKSGRHSTSNGKSSSLKVTLTVLALCGMTALGSGVAPTYAADMGATTARNQYVALKYDSSNNQNETYERINGKRQTVTTFNGKRYIKVDSGVNDNTGRPIYYWVREGYSLTMVDGQPYTSLSSNGRRADVSWTGDANAKPSDILESVTSTHVQTNVTTNVGETLQQVNAGTYAGVTNSDGTEVDGDWDYIVKDSSWKGVVNASNYSDGYANLISKGKPKGFVTTGADSKLAWNATLNAYTYNGKVVDYSNIYVIDGEIGVFTNAWGSEVYTGTVFGKHNEVLMTVKKSDGKYYSYWGAEVNDAGATMDTYRVAEYQKDLNVLRDNDFALYHNDIKSVDMSTNDSSATISLMRNGDGTTSPAVDGTLTLTNGGGTDGKDTYVRISNTTNGQEVSKTFMTGSKVSAIGSTDATTGLTINGVDYTIKPDVSWTAQAGGKDVNAVNQKVNFVGSDHITVTGTDGQIKFEATGVADTDFTNITNTAVTKIKNLAKGEDRHIEAKEYAVDKDGSVTMTYVDGNGNQVAGTAKITGIAKSDLNNITEGGKTVINKLAQEAVKVVNGTNTTVTEGNDGKAKTYAVNVDNAAIQAATDVTGENGISVTSAVENGVKKYTVSAKLSNNFAIDQATGNIDLAPSIAVGKTNPVTINGNTGEITGLSNKTTTAANFADGSGRAATEEQLKEVNSKATAAKTTVTAGKNIDVNGKSDENGSAYTVALADDVSLGNNAIQLKGTDGSISAKSGGAQLAFNSSGLTVSQAKNGLTNETRIDGATITVDGGAGNQTIINGSTARIGSVLVNGGSGTATISGLTNQTTNYTGFANGSGRAATEEQLKEVAGKAGEAIETAGKGWNLTTNGKESGKTNIKPDGTVDFSSGNDNLVISNAGANLSFSLSDNLDLTNNKAKKGSVKVGENTALSNELLQVGKDVSLTASALNVGNSSLTTSALMVGGLTYINSSGLNANSRVISNVAAGTLDTDAVNVGQLKSAISGSQVSIKAGEGIIVEKTGNKYTIKTNIVGLGNEHGTVHVSTDSDPSVVTKSDSTESGTVTPKRAKLFENMLLARTADVAEAADATTTKDTETTTIDDGGKIHVKYSANEILIEAEDGKKADVNDGGSMKVVGCDNIDTKIIHDNENKVHTLFAGLTKEVTVDSLTARSGDTITIHSKVDMDNQKITNLADGEIAEGSTDAVNGGQLYNTNQAVIANAENINSLSHSLNKLDSRINRVGAGAAALAALHPLDFDPDNKWDFAAGYGNYAGANAVAIGTYYRPNENTMFSIGGSFGGGENMINAGVSFKLGSGGSGITTSKTVMAKKIKEQDELLKAQDAKMKEQDEKIAKLEALVAQQGEMIQQALGKK